MLRIISCPTQADYLYNGHIYRWLTGNNFVSNSPDFFFITGVDLYTYTQICTKTYAHTFTYKYTHVTYVMTIYKIYISKHIYMYTKTRSDPDLHVHRYSPQRATSAIRVRSIKARLRFRSVKWLSNKHRPGSVFTKLFQELFVFWCRTTARLLSGRSSEK